MYSWIKFGISGNDEQFNILELAVKCDFEYNMAAPIPVILLLQLIIENILTTVNTPCRF